MAHFPRIRAFGFWTDGGALLASEMELFDAHQSKAINGDEGGAYAPSSVIEIGGSGEKITGPFWSTGTFRVDGLADLKGGATITGGDLTVAQDAVVQGTLDVEDLATLDSLAVVNDASIQGNAEVQGTSHLVGNVTADADVACERLAIHGSHLGSNLLSVNGAARITGNCEINGLFACDGAAAFGSTLGVGGALTVTGNTTFNGVTKAKGRFKRRVLAMTDAPTTVSVTDYDMVYVSSSVLTTARALIISTSGAEEGDVLRVITKNSTYSVDVDYGDGAASYLVASDKQQWLEVTFIGGAWVRTAFGDRITLSSANLVGG